MKQFNTQNEPKHLQNQKPQQKGPQNLRVIPLGGCDEIGKNMTVLEYGNDIMVIDCGLMFPQEEMLGIDFVIPDITYLLQNKHKVRGIVITHGHEDHIGAIPYILGKISPKIYATKLTRGLIEVKMKEFKTKAPDIQTIQSGEKIRLGCFEIEPFHVNHSIPDSVGLAINTPVGLIIHTGDFKFDPTPVEGGPMDFNQMENFGNKGVLALLSDSTNAEIEGHTPSEEILSATFDKIFAESSGRIIVTCFASLINRIQQVLNSASRYGRKVSIVGRSMVNNVEIASKLGYLKIPKGILIPIQQAVKMPDDRIAILCTGSQGQEMSALVRMASGDHKQVKIKKDDIVVISASPIPGNERSISNTINNLYKEGAHVIYGKKLDIHVSGHAAQDELKKMIMMTRPKYFMPIHGEYRQLHIHGDLAASLGFQKEHIMIAENGEVIEFNRNFGQKRNKKVHVGMVMVDGLKIGDVGEVVLRDRQLMAQDGVFVVIMTVDKKTGKLLASPDIISRGFVYMKESEKLLNDTREKIKKYLGEKSGKAPTNWNQVKNKIREDLAKFLLENTGRKPMVLAVVIEI